MPFNCGCTIDGKTEQNNAEQTAAIADGMHEAAAHGHADILV